MPRLAVDCDYSCMVFNRRVMFMVSAHLPYIIYPNVSDSIGIYRSNLIPSRVCHVYRQALQY